MFDPSPFSSPGEWVKAGFHCHTVNSDGGLTPEETVRIYRQRGFGCLGITDHRTVTPVEALSDAGFIGINSTENGGDPDVIGVGVSHAVPEDLPLADRARLLAEQGGFVIAAHPTYCAALPETYLDCPDLTALEIFNAYCDHAYANGRATELWDMLLGRGRRVWGVAGDDAHLNPRKRTYSDAGQAWVEVWRSEASRAGILSALKRGAFYSTQGPRFESITVTASSIAVVTSPVASIGWRSYGKAGHVYHAAPGGALTQSELPPWLKPRVFVRIELADREGRRAWSNPFFLNRDPAAARRA